MPNPTVLIGTVRSAYAPDDTDNRENGAKPYAILEFDRGTPLPRAGGRVAVAGTVDAIFKWMESLPAKRIVEAARAWADMVDALPSISHPPRMEARAQALYDAVRATRAPSEDETPERLVRLPVGNVTVTIKITEDA